MNSALILFVVCAAVIGASAEKPDKDKVAEIVNQCLEETGATPAALHAAETTEEVTDKKIKCFYACAAKKFGTMNEDGTLNKDVEKMNIPPGMDENMKEKFKNYILNCAESSADSDECEAAYKMRNCMAPPKNRD